MNQMDSYTFEVKGVQALLKDTSSRDNKMNKAHRYNKQQKLLSEATLEI